MDGARAANRTILAAFPPLFIFFFPGCEKQEINENKTLGRATVHPACALAHQARTLCIRPRRRNCNFQAPTRRDTDSTTRPGAGHLVPAISSAPDRVGQGRVARALSAPPGPAPGRLGFAGGALADKRPGRVRRGASGHGGAGAVPDR